MGQGARVEYIHVAPAAAEPMRAVPRARAIAGRGLDGDRYAVGVGHWSPIRRSGDSLTLIEGEVVDQLRAAHGLGPGGTRRNVTTRGIRLGELVGRRFRLGEVECRAVRLCEPCSYLDGLLERSVLLELVHRGGIRVEILTDGTIAVGDAVVVLGIDAEMAGEDSVGPSPIVGPSRGVVPSVADSRP